MISLILVVVVVIDVAAAIPRATIGIEMVIPVRTAAGGIMASSELAAFASMLGTTAGRTVEDVTAALTEFVRFVAEASLPLWISIMVVTSSIVVEFMIKLVVIPTVVAIIMSIIVPVTQILVRMPILVRISLPRHSRTLKFLLVETPVKSIILEFVRHPIMTSISTAVKIQLRQLRKYIRTTKPSVFAPASPWAVETGIAAPSR